MYTALYRSQRPEVFDEILGQEHIVKILRNQLASDSVSHAYLFCGTRGTGKTTTARILAKGVNCLSDGERPCGVCDHCKAIKEGSFMDVMEIDAASNNGVENIRELRESVKYPPAAGRKKVYIIDEVHMLSPGAFNALLKTLEEPPEHVMFILATTEPQKLPATILSRCMRLDFRRVPQSVIAENMRRLCLARNVEITDDAARLLANCADGSVRDGLSVLDQVLAGGDRLIDRNKVLEYVGTTGEDFFIDLTELTLLRKSAEALLLLNGVLLEGKDVRQIMKDWAGHYRSLLITKFVKDAGDMLNMSAENLNKIEEQSKKISVEEIDYAVTRLSKTINDARWSSNPRVLLELAIVAIAAGGENEAFYAKTRARQPQIVQTLNTVHTSQTLQTSQTAGSVHGQAHVSYGEPRGGAYGNKADKEQLYEGGDMLKQSKLASHVPEAETSDRTYSEIVSDKAVSGKDFSERVSDNSGSGEAISGSDSAAVRTAPSSSESEAQQIKKEASKRGERKAAVYSKAENDVLWHRIFEEGEGSAGSFNLIRSGTTLESVTEDSFEVEACSSFTKRYVEEKRAQLEALMEAYTGRRLRLKCRLKDEGAKAPEAEDNIEKLAEEARDILGIDIDIE